MREVSIDGHSLTIEQVFSVSREKDVQVLLTEEAINALHASRAWVDKAVTDKRVVYGVTTGFGSFKNHTIPEELTAQLQENLIRSHATGVGRPIPEDVVRAAILIRINSLVKGYSGIRKEVIDFLLAILNNHIHPFVPEKGSVGSSGDLAPLSHIMLLILGEGECMVNGKRVPARGVLEEHGLSPIRLSSKEGLALNNGTSIQTAFAALAIYDSKRLIHTADIAAAMSVQVLMGSTVPFHPKIQEIRNQKGQIECAAHMRDLLENSEIIHSHEGCNRVQDSYSLRCIPQVHGAIRDAFAYAEDTVSREINAATDNPFIFPEFDEAMSGGNFHGEPIAISMDTLGIAISELANISERRTAKMVDPATNEGLPAFLVPTELAGANSGMMIVQYTAAALVSENKVLAHPASVDSIPTSANQEDHVSMGTISARKAHQILENTRNVLAIELLCAAQAAEFRRPLRLSPKTEHIYELIREVVPALTRDRVLYIDIEAVQKLIKLSSRFSSF